MDDAARCPECGSELPDHGKGTCPACLLKLGLSGAIPRVEEPAVATVPPPPAPPGVTSGTRRVGLVAALGVVLAAMAATALFFAFLRVTPAASVTRELRLAILTPGTSDPVSLAVSPDGRQVAFVADHEGHPHVWIRPMDAIEARPLFRTTGASFPFWSPDSRHVGFFAGGELRQVDIGGGSSQTLARAPQPCGGSWAPDGVIVFAPECAAIARVVAGGETQMVTSLESGETGHHFPQLLPGGDRMVFFVDGVPKARGLYVFDFESGERRRVADADSAAVYAPQGYLLFTRQSTLVARRFDPRTLEAGAELSLAEGLAVDPVRHVAALSASAAGPVVYRMGSAVNRRHLAYLDREGRIETLTEPDAIDAPAVSPDGRRIAYAREVNGNTDIWVLDIERGVPSRLTFDLTRETRPLWSRDGRHVLFHSMREGNARIYQVYRTAADGSGRPEPVLSGNMRETVTDASPDGRFLLYQFREGARNWDIAALPLDDARRPVPITTTPSADAGARFSPDGRWIAYQGNESGRFEIFVQAFPTGEARAQITTDGGAHPRWSRDGRTLFFLGPDGTLMEAVLSLGSGSSIQALRVEPLAPGLRAAPMDPAPYDVLSNGRFVVSRGVDEGAARPLTVLLNWSPPD